MRIGGSVLANNVKGDITADIGPAKPNSPLALSSVMGTITLILSATQKKQM
jgi:hypothetical protein